METFFHFEKNAVPELEGIVKGSIPNWVSGSLFINGPMLYKVGETELRHYFDGMAGIQRWKINGGKVTYRRKLVQSETLKKSLDANRLVITQFGTFEYPDPCKNIFQRFFSYFNSDIVISDNTFVTVWPQKDRVFVSSETHVTHEIDPNTLDVINSVYLPEYLTINTATAHNHWDPDGTVHGFGYSFAGRNMRYILYRIPPLSDSKEAFSKIEVVGAIPTRWSLHPCYIHSFSVTDNYYIFAEQTVALSVPILATMKFTGKTPADAFKWFPKEKTLYHIVDKKTGSKVNPNIVYYSDAQLAFHHVNAYEDNGCIVMDLVCYENLDFIEKLYLKNLQSFTDISELQKSFGSLSTVKRYAFPLHVNQEASMNEKLINLPGCKARATKTSKNEVYCQCDVLYDKKDGFEMPQIHYSKYNGKKYRYTYGVGGFAGNLIKINVETKESIYWKEQNTLVSEPVFLPNPEGQDEDDGVILSAVTCFEECKNPFLLVLDAKTFNEKARVEFDTDKFSLTLHGFFKPSQRM